MRSQPRRGSLGHIGLASFGLAVALGGARAEANGRFPSADYFVVGPGTEARIMVLRTTFGLVVSQDSGRRWHWTCEDAYGAMAMVDPPVAIGGDGTLMAGVSDGISITSTLCAWTRPAGDPRVPIVDFAGDATGRTIAAALGPFSSANGLSISNDHGQSWRSGASRASFFIETVEVAPSNPLRMYVSGYALGAVTLILRSDDGGMSMREMTRDLAGGTDAFIAGVDPTNPEVLYVRSNIELGTMLLRSDDGGAHLRRIAATRGRMLGFAISDDGQTVWTGSSNRAEGLQRSVRGGPFEQVGGPIGVSCLRYHAGALFVCANEASDGYSLGYSIDDGDHLLPIMSVRDVTNTPCPRGTPVADRCAPLWPAQEMALRSLDAGVASMRGIDADFFTRPETSVDSSRDTLTDRSTAVETPAIDATDAPDVPDVPDVPDASDASDASDALAGDASLTDIAQKPTAPDAAMDTSSPRADLPMDLPVPRDVAVDAVRSDLQSPPSTPRGRCACRTGAMAPKAEAAWPCFATLALAARLNSRARRRNGSRAGSAHQKR